MMDLLEELYCAGIPFLDMDKKLVKIKKMFLGNGGQVFQRGRSN